MISHALTIVVNELNKHLIDTYGLPVTAPQVGLGNIADGIGGSGIPRDRLNLSLVNIKEEKTLKNLPNHIKDTATMKVVYENQPVFLNCQILVVAPQAEYVDALLMLSRAIRFFQAKNVFTQNNVDPSSISKNKPKNDIDQLETFKLIFDLYSPNMEEVNHLWGTLGGKQYPFVMYMLRLLELKFKATQGESGLIGGVASRFSHKAPAAA